MIRVRNLRKVYGDTTAVDGITFEVPQGEILGFLGPNGAGKSTTMRVLTGYTPPSGGNAYIDDLDVVTQSREVRRILGYLPESAPVYGEMTVRAFVSFFAEIKGLGGAARRSAVDLALEECGLDKVAGRMLMNLSKGYRQRAALAQAVVGDPRVVILDEPTVGLDPRQIREIRDMIRRMAGRRTVILSTHILPEVSLTCSQVVIIDRGHVVATGTPENIHTSIRKGRDLVVLVGGDPGKARAAFEKVKHVRSVDLEGARPGASSPELGVKEASDKTGVDSEAFEFTVHVEGKHDIRADVSKAVFESGLDLLEMRSMGLSLEDVFIHLIADDHAAGEQARAEETAHAG